MLASQIMVEEGDDALGRSTLRGALFVASTSRIFTVRSLNILCMNKGATAWAFSEISGM